MFSRISLLLLLLANGLIAQKTSSLKTYESSEITHKVKTEGVLSKHIAKNGETAIIRYDKSKIIFDVFDKDHQKISSEHVGKFHLESIVGDLFFNNEIKLFSEGINRKNKHIVFCHIFNIKEKSYKKIEFLNNMGDNELIKIDNNSKMKSGFALSPNGKFFTFSLLHMERVFTNYVYDFESLEKINDRAYLNMGNDGKNFFKPNDLLIDDLANVYILSKLFNKGKREKKKGEANYKFILSKVTKKNLQELALNMDEFHIKTMAISKTNEKIFILGLYSKSSMDKVRGACNFIIEDNSFLLISKDKYPLPGEVLNDLYGNRTNIKKKELTNFSINYILNDSVGNTYLTAEEYFMTSSGGYGYNGAIGGYTKENYDDILIIKFNPIGELAWGRSIFKRANKTSYKPFLKNNKLHILMNSGKNISKKADGRTKVSKGILERSALYDIVYGNDGEVSYKKIQDNKGNNYYHTEQGVYENNRFLMIGSKGVRKRYMVLE